MTQEDLDDYSPKLQRALEGTFRGRKVYTTHAPTSGPALLHMLNLLERFENFREEGRTTINVHRIIEIMKCTCGCYSKYSIIRAELKMPVQLALQQGPNLAILPF